MGIKNVIISSLVVVIFVSCKVSYSDIITMPRDDSSPFNFEKTHLWTGNKNPISGPDSVLKIWSDNGTINTLIDDCFSNYYIIPKQNGKTRIYILQKIVDKFGNSDTIMSVSLFKSITPPKIKTVIDTKLLADSAILKYDIVFEKNGKSIFGTRYQHGALPLDIEVFLDNQKIGEIPFYFTLEEVRELLNRGNRIIIPPITLRDMKIDLLFWPDAVDYKYK